MGFLTVCDTGISIAKTPNGVLLCAIQESLPPLSNSPSLIGGLGTGSRLGFVKPRIAPPFESWHKMHFVRDTGLEPMTYPV